MIKFFRKIRYDLMDKNKTIKYLKYAIGEIVLVVIGILIALQINNWNQKRIQNKMEVTYLEALLEEFQENLKNLHRVKKTNAKNIENALELSNLIGPKLPDISEIAFSKLLSGAYLREVQYRPGTGVLNEIISSGKLNIFSNKELKKALASLDGFMLKVRFQELKELYPTRGNLLSYLTNTENFNIRKHAFEVHGELFGVKNSKFLESNLHILQSQEFENNITLFIYTSGFLQSGYYGPLEKRIKKIIEMIKNQLS